MDIPADISACRIIANVVVFCTSAIAPLIVSYGGTRKGAKKCTNVLKENNKCMDSVAKYQNRIECQENLCICLICISKRINSYSKNKKQVLQVRNCFCACNLSFNTILIKFFNHLVIYSTIS